MGVIIDLVNDAQSSVGLVPQALSTSVQGASIDLSNCELATNMVIIAGVTNSLQVTALTVQFEESTDGSNNWTAVTGMTLTVTSLGNSRAVQVARGLRTQRYGRVNAITLAAVTTTGSFLFAAEVICQKKYSPAGAPGADLYPSS